MKPKTEDFLITCLNCKGQSRIKIINGIEVFYIDQTPIISCRLRGDMKWGFECSCGNDSRLAREEQKDMDMLILHPDPISKKQIIANLTENLKIKDENKFRMARA